MTLPQGDQGDIWQILPPIKILSNTVTFSRWKWLQIDLATGNKLTGIY